ncbi:Hypothetical_protein [Hexamita inflata]|uniref:Hypothetical_protein n=1 Tax=Hexamita inflata TaxID=28002 RepID=A0AA86RQE3_9EUKA|nr:Hypothetical protein HINF_LOCUS66416 [Hexamita inflata]
MSYCIYGYPYAFRSICEADCGYGMCQMNSYLDYCCTVDLSGIHAGLSTLASILVGIFVGGGLLLLLSIVGCYFCCCRPTRTQSTVIVKGGQQQVMQPISVQLIQFPSQQMGSQINQISMPIQ